MSIDKSTIVGLQMEMIKRFSANTMRRGWKYEQEGHVASMDVRGECVYAQVRAKDSFHVKLDLQKFDNSRCSCSSNRYCHHMAAVFFHIYSLYEKRTELFLHQHQQMRLIKSQERTRKKKDSQDQRALWENGHKGVREEDPLNVWQHDLEKKFTGFFTPPLHHVESFHAEAEAYVKRVSSHWRSPVRELYQAVAQLFMLVLAENRYMSLTDGYKPQQLQNSFLKLFDLCVNTFRQRMDKVERRSSDGSVNGKWREIGDFMHAYVFRAVDTPVKWLDIYRSYGWKLQTISPEALGRERSWLEKQLADADSSGRKSDKLKLGLIHLDMLNGNDEAVSTKLIPIVKATGDIDQCFTYVEHFSQTQDWPRMKEMLLEMLDAVRENRSKTRIFRYLGYWDQLDLHLDCGEQRLEVFLMLLPYSYASYAQYLEQTKNYKQWIDLEMYAEHSPAAMNRSMIAEMEQQDVAVLLPLYHQTIDRSIAEKKRESYKQAVHMLKTLQGYYERLEQEVRFQVYMRKLIDKYKMLRAFQEELRRGNLIP